MLFAELRRQLAAAGIDPDAPGDPALAWRRLRERHGRRVTLIERYALEAAARGVAVDGLDAELRGRLGQEVLAAQLPGFATFAAGAREPDPVRVVPYDPGWPAVFAAWAGRLAQCLGDEAVWIEHVGSTAVPGLAAKPTVDVQVSVPDVAADARYAPRLESAGLVRRSRDDAHQYFRPPRGEPRTVHVHVCAAGGAWEREHLLLRDHLRATPATRDAYGALKRRLADAYGDDRLAYTDAKTGFILDALDQARAWAARTGWAPPGATSA